MSVRIFLWVWLFMSLSVSSAAQDDRACQEALIKSKARQDIEYLRRSYARATDALGTGDPAAVKQASEIYHSIFTAEAKLSATGMETPIVGPDGWIGVVTGTLGPMGPTQHLIGTQMVEITNLKLDDNCQLVSGAATMNSYVQAWHTLADGKIWTFIGNYVDEVVFSAESGWQIQSMMLERITEETR